jgi:hypothetical protein
MNGRKTNLKNKNLFFCILPLKEWMDKKIHIFCILTLNEWMGEIFLKKKFTSQMGVFFKAFG